MQQDAGAAEFASTASLVIGEADQAFLTLPGSPPLTLFPVRSAGGAGDAGSSLGTDGTRMKRNRTDVGGERCARICHREKQGSANRGFHRWAQMGCFPSVLPMSAVVRRCPFHHS
jgi:hypothetical protein